MEEFCINDLERNCQNRHFKIALMYCSGSLNLIFKIWCNSWEPETESKSSQISEKQKWNFSTAYTITHEEQLR